jgi:hypothetical protein
MPPGCYLPYVSHRGATRVAPLPRSVQHPTHDAAVSHAREDVAPSPSVASLRAGWPGSWGPLVTGPWGCRPHAAGRRLPPPADLTWDTPPLSEPAVRMQKPCPSLCTDATTLQTALAQRDTVAERLPSSSGQHKRILYYSLVIIHTFVYFSDASPTQGDMPGCGGPSQGGILGNAIHVMLERSSDCYDR